MPVRDELLTGHGRLHGGVFASVAEALASRGTALAVMPNGFMAMGLSNDTTILEPVGDGVVDVEARVLSRGADAWVLDGRGARRRGAPVRLLADHRRGAADAP